jgi:hypothetical protein
MCCACKSSAQNLRVRERLTRLVALVMLSGIHRVQFLANCAEESKAEKAAEALKKLLSPSAGAFLHVGREGLALRGRSCDLLPNSQSRHGLASGPTRFALQIQQYNGSWQH